MGGYLRGVDQIGQRPIERNRERLHDGAQGFPLLEITHRKTESGPAFTAQPIEIAYLFFGRQVATL
jgi:hypothetical protein